MDKPSQRSKKKTTAQAMVEFALALPILLLVVYGLLETGRLLFMYASVVTAARQAARYGSASGDNGSGTNYYSDCNGIRGAANRVAFIQRFSLIKIEWDTGPNSTAATYCNPSNLNWTPGHPANGDRISVTVESQFRPIVPLVPLQPFTISSTDSRTLLIGAHIEVTPASQGYTGSTALVLGKSANKATFTAVGEVIQYTYTIQNLGTTAVDGPFYISDDKINGGTPFQCAGAPATLVGGSAVITCNNTQSYAVKPEDIDAGSVTNTAVATNGDNTVVSNTASVTVTFVAAPKITLTKTGTAPLVIAPGENVTYSFTITNSGNTPLRPPYAIQDSLLSTPPNCPQTPNPLPIGQTIACTGQYPLTSKDINHGSVTNTATATGKYGSTTVTSAPVTVVVQTPALLLIGTVAPTPISSLPATVTYTFSLENRTTSAMSNIRIGDTRGWNNQVCVASLAAGGKATNACSHTYSVTQADFDSPTGNFTNVATATAQGGINSNQVTIPVYLEQHAVLTLAKTASPTVPTGGAFSTGEVITYTYTIKNSGNVTISPTSTAPMKVTDDDLRVAMSAGCTITNGSLAIGATQSCTGTLTLQDVDIAAGSVTSTGKVDATFGATTISGTSTYTLVTYYNPRLAIVKTADKIYFTAQGERIEYSYAIKNTGGQVLNITSNYALSDDKAGGVACPLATAGKQLLLGTSIPCNPLSYPVSALDVTAKKVTNVVTKTSGSTTPPTDPVASSSVTVTMLTCGPGYPASSPNSPIPSGSNTSWGILNNTGTALHVSGASMTWTGGVLQQVLLGGQAVWTGSAAPNGTMVLPVTGWPALPFNGGPTVTTMAFKFQTSASNIKVTLQFQEIVGGVACSITSP